MLQGVDLLVLLGLLRRPVGDWTVRSLAAELWLPPATVQRALERLAVVGVFDAGRRRVNVGACEELFMHALGFIAPAVVVTGVRPRVGVGLLCCGAWMLRPWGVGIARAGASLVVSSGRDGNVCSDGCVAPCSWLRRSEYRPSAG